VHVKWLIGAYNYIRSRPQIIINGFIAVGILDRIGSLHLNIDFVFINEWNLYSVIHVFNPIMLEFNPVTNIVALVCVITILEM